MVNFSISDSPVWPRVQFLVLSDINSGEVTEEPSENPGFLSLSRKISQISFPWMFREFPGAQDQP